MEWIESEFAWLELGDLRREKRVKTIVEQFSKIAESQPGACMGDSDLEALYRVAKNPAITTDAILDAHQQAAIV
ncbi:IS4/Tn5 family transposase DNA-binding protein, partial [Allorhodopirellula solitaria]|uniref:IS4/Tn5 family transposase DNA-binding protein n=1 Tax=Allorhodopirellula solitaria TaxID=2527987 RepID=UPI001C954E1D